jgi:hypothetical protein
MLQHCPRWVCLHVSLLACSFLYLILPDRKGRRSHQVCDTHSPPSLAHNDLPHKIKSNISHQTVAHPRDLCPRHRVHGPVHRWSWRRQNRTGCTRTTMMTTLAVYESFEERSRLRFILVQWSCTSYPMAIFVSTVNAHETLRSRQIHNSEFVWHLSMGKSI